MLLPFVFLLLFKYQHLFEICNLKPGIVFLHKNVNRHRFTSIKKQIKFSFM